MLEELRVANLVRTPHRSTSSSEAGWAAFRTILVYTAACAGKHVVLVEPADTTQDCAACGERVPQSGRDRTPVCPSCGLIVDRDEPARPAACCGPGRPVVARWANLPCCSAHPRGFKPQRSVKR